MFNVAEKITSFEPIVREKLKLEVKTVTETKGREVATAFFKGEAFIKLEMGGGELPRLRVKILDGTKTPFQTINHVLRRLGAPSFYKEKGAVYHHQQINSVDGANWFEVDL